jgi:hypothetical protein
MMVIFMCELNGGCLFDVKSGRRHSRPKQAELHVDLG